MKMPQLGTEHDLFTLTKPTLSFLYKVPNFRPHHKTYWQTDWLSNKQSKSTTFNLLGCHLVPCIWINFRLVGWLVVFNVPSTARSFRDGTPIYCPLQRTWSSINTPFGPGIEPRAVVHTSLVLYMTLSIRKCHKTSKFKQLPWPKIIESESLNIF